MVIVEIPGPLRIMTKGEKSLEASGETLRQVLVGIDHDYPGFLSRIVGQDGTINRFITVYLDDEDIRHLVARELNPLDVPTPDGSKILLIPAMAGG